MPASTPPRESASGAPDSSVSSAASSRACSRARRAAAFRSEPRASGAVRAHERCAARALSTAWLASVTPPAGTWPMGSPVAGSRTASSGTRLDTRISTNLVERLPAGPTSNTCGVTHLIDNPAFSCVAHVTKTPARRPRVMTNERTEAYGRVVQTLDEIGATKLLPAEQARIRDAADTLIFASDLEEAQDALRDMGSLTEHLLTSGRWLEERIDMLVANLLACGPSNVPAAA